MSTPTISGRATCRPASRWRKNSGTETAKTCGRSAIADVTADLTDFNVNQNAWISSMLLYKLGLFGIDWDSTPWMDNKASFQRGINQAVRRTATELADNLGRVRTTSQIDRDLQDARGNLQFDEETWYFGLHPFGPKTPTPSYYRDAVNKLRAFNDRLQTCQTVFDARADNLKQYLDRIASDIGSTSAILKERAENHNNGWFDTRADDRYWFAYGQLYAYYGLLKAAQADFEDVIKEKHLQKSLGHHGPAVRLGAQDPAADHRQWPRGRLAAADPPHHHGVLHSAGALQPGRDQQRPGAVGIGRLRQA